MRRKYTHFRNLRTGKPKNPGLKTNRRRTASNLVTNYELMLQLYCLKKEATIKKELKYQKLSSGKLVAAASKPSYSISAMISSFVSESLLLLKKVRPGIAIVTE